MKMNNLKNKENGIEIIFTSNRQIGIESCFQDHDQMLEEQNQIAFITGQDDKTVTTKMILPKHQSFVSVELSSENNRIRLALGVFIRLVLPFVNGLTKRLRDIKNFKSITDFRGTRGLFANILAYAANTISMSLSSVQVVHKFNLIKAMKSRIVENNSKHDLNHRSIIQPIPNQLMIEDGPEKCVTCTVLAEPPAGIPIRADIIFIHGLHGSLAKTWKQGLWNTEGRQAKFQRPPKPPVRPPKRPKHSRDRHDPPAHHTKRPRFEDYNQFEIDFLMDNDDSIENSQTILYENQKVTYYCNEPKPNETKFVDDVEFSFPTFRFRVDDIDNDENMEELKFESPNVTKANKNKNNDNDDTNDKWSACWPGDWLPKDCPGVRVLALNYTTDPYLWRPIWVRKRKRTSLVERAREMQELLIEKKVGIGHPIVWVGHSKGGLFIKQIIVDAWESGRASLAPLWRSSRGVLFYSVPHRGSALADFSLPLLKHSVELVEIQKDCASILELHRRFVALYRDGQLKIRVFSFIETALTFMSVLFLRIVGVDSADPGIGEVCGVRLDHREICKPRSRQCMLYTELTKMINKIS